MSSADPGAQQPDPVAQQPVGRRSLHTRSIIVEVYARDDGLLDLEARLTDVKDGTSNTLMVGELSWNDANYYRIWTRGTYTDAQDRDATCCRNVFNAIKSTPYNGTDNANDTSFGSQHTGTGANFALADGSVRWIDASITLGTYLSVASYNGGEAVNGF